MVPARKVCPFAKDNLRVIVRLTLVLAGEVQVDIRLLISLKAQEGLKRDIKALLRHHGTALRAALDPAYRSLPSPAEFLYILGIKIASNGISGRDNAGLRDSPR